jgi:phosphonate transport system permease protein
MVAGLYAKFLWDTEVSVLRLERGLPWMAHFIVRMFPPDFSVLNSALRGDLQTLEIAVVGTSLAALLPLPLWFLSARNIAPPTVFYSMRGLLDLFRSIDTMVYALFFVAAVGLGPFPGVMAVVVYTTMSLAKLYSEAIEGIDTGPVEALTAMGATRLQILRTASSLRSSRCSSPTFFIVWRPTFERLRSWVSWGLAASDSIFRLTCA